MNKEKNIGIVTGGSKGIGKSISLGLAKKNTDLLITYFRDNINAVKTCNVIKELGVKCHIYKVDLSKLDQVDSSDNLLLISINNFSLFATSKMPPEINHAVSKIGKNRF